MAKRPSRIEAKLDEIARAKDAPDRTAILTRFLDDSASLAVARAAEAARELRLEALTPALERAFLRIVAAPPEKDKGCAAKLELLRALDALEAHAYDAFEAAIRFQQIEAGWEEKIDVAAPLRAIAAGGIGRIRHPDAMNLLVELLVDPEKIARMGAAQGLGCTGMHEAIGVLRLKALIGDADAEVVGECFASLLVLDPDKSIAFVARFLESDREALREASALALGQSRREDAFSVLEAAWAKEPRREFRRVLLLAVAIMRVPKATDFLFGLVERGEKPAAAEALAALATYRSDPALSERASASVSRAIERGAPASLKDVFVAEFSR